MSESENGHTPDFLPQKDFFRIGEVSRLTATKAFVLRYWETEFPMLEPVKSPKGHRLYRREDVKTVLEIRRLLYDEGFTIAGARRHLREHEGHPSGSNGESATGVESSEGIHGESAPVKLPSHASTADPLPTINRKVLLDLRDALRAFLTLLETE
jgi:DNA-binding transcriptional MerR regulator